MARDDIANEQIRLLASALNTVAASSLTLSTVAPVLAMLSYDESRPVSFARAAVSFCFGLTTAGTLHALARRVLRSLHETSDT